MEWIPLTPLNLFKVREVLEESPTFVRSNNIGDLQDFAGNLFTEELPGKVHFYSLEQEGKILGFVKYCEAFPLPGFTHLRLLVFKEESCGKGLGSKVIDNLKTKGTLWIESPSEQFSLSFWQSKGFKEEAGRWVL